MGLEIGYREREVAHMHFGKWCDLFEKYKFMHNMRIKKGTFEEEKKVASLMDL